jgi:hypothetical protein
MSKLTQILPPIAVDWSSYGLSKTGVDEMLGTELASFMPRILKYFGLQIVPDVHQSLEKFLLHNSDSRAQALFESLDRAVIRHVDELDFESCITNMKVFSEPTPAAAIYKPKIDINYPEYLGSTKIQNIVEFSQGDAFDAALESRVQTFSNASRKQVWNTLFQNFFFGPVIQICDPYLLEDMQNKSVNSGSAVDRTGLGYLLRRLSEDRDLCKSSETNHAVRRLQILTTASRSHPESKKFQQHYKDHLQAILETVNPAFAVEVTITDTSGKGQKNYLHDRFAMVNKNGSVIRTLSITNSVSAYLAEFPSTTPITFSFSTNMRDCQVLGTFWTKTQQTWRNRGAFLEWEAFR